MLVTQNIDNYHTDVLPKLAIDRPEGTETYAFTPGVYEIHGNVLYMRCSDSECKISKYFYKCPDSHDDIVPVCKECKSAN